MVAIQHLLTVALLLISISCGNDGARILGLFPIPGTSHKNVNSALMKELARRGHHVTVLSPFHEENRISNYTEIVMKKLTFEELLEVSESEAPDLFDMGNLPLIQRIFFLMAFGCLFCDRSLQDEQVQKLMHSDEEFDLIIMEAFYVDCFIGFAHKFKVPAVQVCTFGGTETMGDLVGNPNPYAYVPDVYNEFGDHMSFTERIVNAISGVLEHLGNTLYLIPKQDALMRKYFNDKDMPSIVELQKYTSLMLVNNHFSLSYVKPLVPNLVQVGGMHVEPPKELPEDIKKFIGEATDGVIFFSMGSNLKSCQMPADKVKSFLTAFSKLKQRVLWKWEAESLPGLPKNVKLGKWLPQSDILAHPNVRLFITHGGLLSTQETIARGVPVLGIPIFGDQRLNMARSVSAGFGLKLEYANITSESVEWAVNEVLRNPRYHENARRLSRIYRDQPLSPLEQAVFWTEYVIRHKGAPHMRSAALDLTWYQYFLLDVIAVLALAVLFVNFIGFLLIRYIIKKVFGNSSQYSANTMKKKKN